MKKLLVIKFLINLLALKNVFNNEDTHVESHWGKRWEWQIQVH